MRFLLTLLAVVGLVILPSVKAEKVTLRVGYFPNVTHAQGVIGKTLTAEGKGWFEKALGPDVTVVWFPFNAGPSAMEAIFTDSVDLTYVGPSPALNAFVRSRGEEIRILSGAANGGAALVVRPEGGIKTPEDFRGKKIATPQLGNTQDVAARIWLRKQGFTITQTGGDVSVLPTANPDQLSLFKLGKLDGVWTVEPWVSRLELEAGGKVFHEQNDTVTTLLVASVKTLKARPELVKAFVAAHRELTKWIQSNPSEARALVQRGLSAEVHREIPLALIEASWKRLSFTSDITLSSIESMAADARALGFIRGSTDLTPILQISQ